MESILKNKQVNYEYGEDGKVTREDVQGSNFDVKDGEDVKGGYNIYSGGASINLYGLGLSFDELKGAIEGFISSLKNDEEPAEGESPTEPSTDGVKATTVKATSTTNDNRKKEMI